MQTIQVQPIPTNTCPQVAPVYQRPAVYQQPVQTRANVPVAISEHVELIGPSYANPDPQQYVYEQTPLPERKILEGPYGPSGEIIRVPGTYQGPVTRRVINADVGNHPVIVNGQ
jgi:hypothetical protein